MNGKTDFARPHLTGLIAGLFLAAGLVLAAMVVTRAWLKISESQTISVTGSARKNVRADLVIWSGWATTEAASLVEAQKQLKSSSAVVERFLRSHSVTNFTASPIQIQELRATVKGEHDTTTQKTVGYRLSQGFEIRSGDVDVVARLERDSVALVEQGVVFSSVAPQYIYTKAGETKVEMLAEATKDARARAEQIAVQGGRKIEQLQSARMGVFQIAPMHSTQTSWDGMNDVTSLEKTVTAVVSATFSMK